MGQHAFHTPSPSDLLDRVWQGLPYVPRAVAQLIYFMEAGEVVGQLLNDGEAELATCVLADTYPNRSAFEATYGMSWQAAHMMFSQAVQQAAEHPQVREGDRVIYDLCAHMLYRLGYIDGLEGAFEPRAPNDSSVEFTPPVPETASEELATQAVRYIHKRLLHAAYNAGFSHGMAEKDLCNSQPKLLQAVDDRAYVLREIGMGSPLVAARDLAEVVQEHEEELNDIEIDSALVYAEGRVHQLRIDTAQRAVQRYLKNESVVSPLAIASVLRVLAQEVRRNPGPENSNRRDELDAAIVLASTLGFLPGTVDALLAPMPDESVVDIVSKHKRDYRFADMARQIVAALSEPPPSGRLWPNSYAKTPQPLGSPTSEPVPLTSLESLRALRITLQNGQRGHAALEDIRQYRARLHRLKAPASVAGSLLGQHVALRCRFNAQTDPAVFVRAMLAAEGACESTLWAHMERHLLRRFTVAAARSLLEAWDPSSAHRGAAEAELARRGRVEDAELAEAWVRMYHFEARSLRTREALAAWQGGFSRESPAAEGLLLLARAWLVEGALDRRAWREAQAEVARHVPIINHKEYEAPDAEALIRHKLQGAAFQALAAAERRNGKHPHVAARVLQFIPVAVLEALVVELGVVEELQAREGQ